MAAGLGKSAIPVAATAISGRSDRRGGLGCCGAFSKCERPIIAVLIILLLSAEAESSEVNHGIRAECFSNALEMIT